MTSNKNIGVIWDKEVNNHGEKPFVKEGLNKDFAHYAELAEEKDLTMYIANYESVKNTKMAIAWYWNGEEWEKKEDIELDGVYDKYKFDPETKKLKKELAEKIPVLNDPKLEEICKDKLETYELFSEYVPETKKATKENAEKMLEKNDKVVFKPRFGFAGEGVEIIEDIDEFTEPNNTDHHILQAFIKTEGVPKWDVTGAHDLRTIIINGELQETGNYIRVPDEGLISNISRGGKQRYVEAEEIPEEAKEIIKEITKKFEKYSPSIFSVDFMFDENMRPWVVELNSKPGTYYHHPVKEKEKELPKIKNIIQTLKQRVMAE